MTRKHTIDKLYRDLQPAVQSQLVEVYPHPVPHTQPIVGLDIVFPHSTPHEVQARLAQYIVAHYGVYVYFRDNALCTYREGSLAAHIGAVALTDS